MNETPNTRNDEFEGIAAEPNRSHTKVFRRRRLRTLVGEAAGDPGESPPPLVRPAR